MPAIEREHDLSAGQEVQTETAVQGQLLAWGMLYFLQVMGEPQHLVVGQIRECLGYPRVDQLSICQQHGPLGALCQADVVGYHQDSLILLHQLAEEIKYFISGTRIQVASWLIGDQDGWVIGESTRDSSRLLLSAGDRRGEFVGEISQPDQAKQLPGSPFPLGGFVHTRQDHRQDNILQQCQCGHELVELENNPEVLPAPQGHIVLAHSMDVGRANADRP